MPGKTDAAQTLGTGRWDGIAGLPPDKHKGEKSGGDEDAPAYYDISMLKPPVWTPEIGAYFFLGGLSAGAFVLARLAERFGGGRLGGLTRVGTAVAVAAVAALPCAPLLIADLGDPKRFHHMLRVWKPTSPMNLGSWTLTAYMGVGGLAVLQEIARARRGGRPAEGVAQVGDIAAGALADGAGIPLALLLAGYTGVLLSTTATPVWSKNPWIGALFSASAVSAGAGAVRVALEIKGSAEDEAAAHILGRVETAARVAEAVAHAGFLADAGPLAKPLTGGKQKTAYLGGAIGAGLVIPEILNRLPLPEKSRRWVKIAAGVVGLIGGYALRAAFVAAGCPSANDPDAARRNSRR
ncbi:MAG: polysulfide reductase NrfD [Armatimonadota bacterium]|nr:polysulfide reductase NrfD [Armatimonadota bacterium]